MSTAIDSVFFLVLYLSIALSITQDLFLILLNQQRRERPYSGSDSGCSGAAAEPQNFGC